MASHVKCTALPFAERSVAGPTTALTTICSPRGADPRGDPPRRAHVGKPGPRARDLELLVEQILDLEVRRHAAAERAVEAQSHEVESVELHLVEVVVVPRAD